MVGGEQAKNEEVKKNHEQKLKHVEERKQKLQGMEILVALAVHLKNCTQS